MRCVHASMGMESSWGTGGGWRTSHTVRYAHISAAPKGDDYMGSPSPVWT